MKGSTTDITIKFIYFQNHILNMAEIKVPKLIDIIAVGQNLEMGNQGKLPWSGMKIDVGMFVKRTLENPVLIMGDVTFLSIPGGPLSNRKHFILSQNPTNPKLQRYSDRIHICGNIPEAFEKINEHHPDQTVINVGGGQIFQALRPYTHGIYLTTLDISPEADTFYPKLNRDEWEIQESQTWQESNGTNCIDEYLVRRTQVPDYI